MKAFLISILCMFILFSSFAENEPNNSMTEANPISVNSSSTGHIGGGVVPNVDQYDWWVITLPSHGSLTITTLSGLDVCVVSYLKLSDGTSSITDTWAGSCNDTVRTMTASNLTPGTYFIQCSRYSGSGNYTITTSFTSSLFPTDLEPNNYMLQAIEIQTTDTAVGILGYIGLNYLDESDWYKITLTEDGGLTLRVITNLSLTVNTLYLYDSDTSTIIASGNWGTDATVNHPNLSPGTYYINIHRYGSYGGYQLISSFVPAMYPNDNLDNNLIEHAQIISVNDSTTGRLGYYNNGYTDLTDYYKFTIQEDGMIQFHVVTTQTLYTGELLIYDTDSTTMIVYGSWGQNAQAIHNNISPGTYFLKISRYTGYGSYYVTSTFTPANYPNDIEPNDLIQNSTTILPNDSITGRLGYYGSGFTDNSDYYQFTIPSDGSIRFRIVTMNSLQTNNLLLYDSDSTSIINSGGWGTDAVLEQTNLAAGNYFLAVNRYVGYGSYYITSTFTPAYFINDVEPNSPAQNSISLNLGDTVTGHLGYYGSGVTDVSDWYRFNVTERGKVTFYAFGTGSLQFNNLLIYAQDTTTMIGYGTWGVTGSVNTIITEPGTYFFNLNRYVGHGSYQLTSEFKPVPTADYSFIQNLHTVTFTNLTTGADLYTWNFGDGITSNLVNPIHTFAQPGEYFVELIAQNECGPDTMIQQITILGVQGINANKGGNNGIASFYIFGGGLTPNATVKLKRTGYTDLIADTVIKPNVSSIKATFDLTSVPVGVWDVEVAVPGSLPYTLANSYTVETGIEPEFDLYVSGRNKILFNRWQTYTINYSNLGNVDMIGAPFFLLISDIPGLQVEFLSKTIGIPSQPNNIWWQSLQDSTEVYFTIDSLDGEPFTARVYPLFIPNIPASYSGSFTIRIKSPTDVRIVTWVNDPYATGSKLNDYQTCIMWAQATALANGIVNILGNLVPGAQCVSSVSQTLYGLAYNETSIGSGLHSIANAGLSCAFDIGRNLPIIKAWELSYGIYSLINDVYSNYSAVEECKSKFPKDKPTDNNIQAVSSFDPNEIIGVKGYKNEHFTGKETPYHYQIYFENLATATAPAQEVFIYDTLDLTKYNITHFTFGNVGFGDTILYPIQNGYEFSIDVDLRPTKNIITRISGLFDTITGIIKWSFVSLDPATMDLTEDPMGGFLPPNINYPDGVGFVSFTIGVNENLSHGSVINNQATIVFDLNPQILTNVWSNEIDLNPPSSAISALESTIYDTTFLVSWSGNDNESGLLNYSIFVSKNSGIFYEWISKTNKTEAWFTGEFGNIYSFFSIARDSVGNIELDPTFADQTVSLEPSGINQNNNSLAINIFPNPCQDFITLDMSVTDPDPIYIEIINPLGKIIYSSKIQDITIGRNKHSINTSSLPCGLYSIKIRNKKNQSVLKFVKCD